MLFGYMHMSALILFTYTQTPLDKNLEKPYSGTDSVNTRDPTHY